MKRHYILVLSVTLAVLIGGCASLPNATVGYYFAKSDVSVKVNRTVTCDANSHVIVVNSSTPSVAHSADRGQLNVVSLAKLNGKLADADVKFDFYEDGRLKGVNSSSTGQGETALKTVVTIAAAIFALDGGSKTYPNECDFIKKAGGDKPLTITYEGEVDITKSANERQPIKPATASSFYASKLANAIGDVCTVVEDSNKATKAPVDYTPENGDVLLQAKQPGSIRIKVTAGGNDCQHDTVWEGELPVAQIGTSYPIPLPTPAIFGKKGFAASFQESGALTSLQYTSNTGAGQTLNVTSSALTALKGETTAQKAADVKAEADLIAQQQRLAQCLADPTNCK